MDLDDFRPELIHPYDPRLNPHAPPAVDICAAPVVTICLNVEWFAHVSGMIARLTYDDAWLGTADEIHSAVESIYKILNVGRPTMGCGCGSSGLPSRYNADGVYQVSYDGGVTWVDAPAGDYRNTVTLFPPLAGDDGDAKKCQTATNIRGHIEHQADELAADASAWGELTLLIAALAALAIFMFPVSLALMASTPFIVAAGGALLTVGQAGFAAAMTTAVYDTLECLIYCNIQNDGTFTPADLAAIRSGIASQIGGVAQTYLLGVIDALGVTGLENMGRTGSGLAADCSDCEDCVVTCSEKFDALQGTILERGDGYIIVEAAFAGGQWTTEIQTASSGDCCIYVSREVVSGDISAVQSYWKECGSDSVSSGLGGGQCVWNLATGSFYAFTVKYYLDDCT